MRSSSGTRSGRRERTTTSSTCCFATSASTWVRPCFAARRRAGALLVMYSASQTTSSCGSGECLGGRMWGTRGGESRLSASGNGMRYFSYFVPLILDRCLY